MTCNVERSDIDQYLNDNNPPFMIEKCYGDDWSQPDFDNKCCGKYNGEEVTQDILNTEYDNTLCIPTIQGGYCRGSSPQGITKFFKYRETIVGSGEGARAEFVPYIIQDPYVETPWNVDLADEISRPRDLYEDYTKDLRNELYNEVMVDRIMRSSPQKIKENYDKDNLKLQQLEEEDLQILINEIKQNEKYEKEEIDFIYILKITTLIGSILALSYFIYNQFKHHKSKKSKNVFDVFDLKQDHKVKHHKKSKFKFKSKKSK
tara:strand:+ start:46 stop:828 length:783 start_codon:yes stop_codon:yes gene_type:complete